MIIRFKQIHHFFIRQALYPMALSTLLACTLFAGRVYLSDSWNYHFLVWNLFLAWIPYLGSLWMVHIYRRQPRRWWVLLMPGLVWMAFFPNAPYLVTDFLHLRYSSGVPIWYDVILLSAFAWTGLFLGIFSLRAMQTVVKAMVGSLASWLFVVGVVGLSGLGIYLGRFLRWNSWDLIFHPQAILADVFTRLANPLHHPGAFGVTLLFALFLMVCYLTITASPLYEHS